MVTAPQAPLQVTPRLVRPLALAAVGFVVVAAFQVPPGPGVHGRHVAVTIALVGLAGATIVLVRWARPAANRDLPVAAVAGTAALSAAVLTGLQPNGPGFLGVFPAVSGAALRLPARLSAGVAVVAVAALAVSWSVAGHRSVDNVVLNELGVVAFYIVSMFARRLRESNEHARSLIAELEETRAAQAQAAALSERQRLAREMHDVLAHTLSGLVLNLEGARLLAGRAGTDPEIRGAVDRAHRLAKTGLGEARRAIAMLRDDEVPGPHGLAALAAAFAEDCGVPCEFAMTGDIVRLDSDCQLTLYRVAQESLTNIRKHARPDRVAVTLAYEETGVCLTVEDVGATAPVSASNGGYGLTGMRERAELLGGTLSAAPTATGFRVALRVPV
jgi:signal transduction histidine kinase